MRIVRLFPIGLALLLVAAAPRSSAATFPNIPYATWSDDEPQYRLYPGDEIDVAVPSAPELNKTVIVQPDGRVQLPLVAPQMAADRTPTQLERALTRAYADELLRPEVRITVRAQPLRVFVGGEVGKPGVYDMPGDIDALRGVIQAGGFGDNAKRSQVVIIRRGPGGQPMMRTVDLGRSLKTPAGGDLVPLRRFDIIFVPRSGLGDIDVFMTQVRNALPINFSYAFGNAAIF
jgi:polysaccharide export outer membrane protein